MLIIALHSRFPLLFESPGYRWLWLANLVSKLGDWLGIIALNLYVFDLTGSATALAVLLAVESIPALLISPLAGVIVDRLSRRRVMMVANLVAAMMFALLPLMASLWQIYILALLWRVTISFMEPAERSLIPDLVGKDKVLSANSGLSAVNHLAFDSWSRPLPVSWWLLQRRGRLWADAVSFLFVIFPFTGSPASCPDPAGWAQLAGLV